MSLPPISQQTKQTLKRQGFINRLYDDLKLNECYKPRTFAHSFYTYSIMAASAIGYIIAKRGGYSTLTLGASFFVAPTFALLQKRQIDYYENSANTIIHPKQLAQEFPILNQQYKKVLNQVEEEIALQKQILRELQNQK